MSLSSDTAIRVSNLSKLYKIYHKPADMFWELVNGKPRYKPFWALQNISFEVKRGQVVGIMGRNGAGKSTLLKIITGTLDKTAGEVVVNGRISSILELGTGFNGEYTGRENIYLGGLIVGMTREEVKRKIDWIIEFSELRDFIDQPFKTYSTGMQARLTFSTAVCIDPDILIVDEALSVGDAKFARKCYNKIDEFRQVGQTILLVSHDINTISTFCDHAILLENGQIMEQGEPKHVSKIYWRLLFVDEEKSKQISLEVQTGQVESNPAPTPTPLEVTAGPPANSDAKPEPQDQVVQPSLSISPTPNNDDKSSPSSELRAGNRKEAEIIDFGIRDLAGNRVTLLESGQKYVLFLTVLFHEDVETPGFGFHITNQKGVVMYGIGTTDAGVKVPPRRKGELLEGQLHVTMWLTNGDYFLSGGVGDSVSKVIDFRYDALVFTIPRLPWIQHASVVNLEPRFEFKTMEPASLASQND